MKEEKRDSKKRAKQATEEKDQADKEDGLVTPPEKEKKEKAKNKEFIAPELMGGIMDGAPKSLAQSSSSADDEDEEAPPQDTEV